MTTTRPRYAVVTDSSADITSARAEELGIRVVPLPVTVGNETFDDGTITQEELFRRIGQASSAPTTSQPSPGALETAYQRALETADTVVALHISSGLSGTCEVARTVSQQFGGRVHVFDSRNLSWGLGWQVIEAAAASAEGLDVAEALTRLERVRDEVKIVVTLDSLEGLRRSGRIGTVATYLGSILNLRVSVAVNPAGAFVPVRGNRGNRAAADSMLSWVSKHMGGAEGGSFAVGHALAPERAQMLAAAIRDRWRVDELVMYEAGAAIAVHAGTIWGVAFRPRS
jgi:DegV family protein with EDD domain